MSDAEKHRELRDLDIRIATELFGWKVPQKPCFRDNNRPEAKYSSDWSAIPKLVEACEQRGWHFSAWHDNTRVESWSVKLIFANGPGGLWIRRGHGDGLPLALCRAIVAVLDALEETKKEARKS